MPEISELELKAWVGEILNRRPAVGLMARYFAALAGGGANEHGSVRKPRTHASMFAPHYQPDPRLPGIGLGFFRVDFGGHLAVEHQGILPGFNSQIFMAPHDGVGVMGFTNGARQAVIWLTEESRTVAPIPDRRPGRCRSGGARTRFGTPTTGESKKSMRRIAAYVI